MNVEEQLAELTRHNRVLADAMVAMQQAAATNTGAAQQQGLQVAQVLVGLPEALAQAIAGAQSHAGGAAAPPRSLIDVRGLGRPQRYVRCVRV